VKVRPQALQHVASSSMLLSQCPSCGYVNPADSNICSGCSLPLRGVPSHLAPCPVCGALNGVAATPCWACDANLEIRTSGFTHLLLADRDGDAILPSGPASEVAGSGVLPVSAKNLSRQRFGLIIGSAVLATLAAFGYSAYRQRSIVDSPASAALPAAAADPDLAAADDAKKGKADKGAELPGIATSSPLATPAAAARATASNVGTDQDVVNPPKAVSAGAAAVKGQKTTNAAARIERQLPGLGPCTESVAAIGLCTRTERQSPGLGPCTEANAALGLCTPVSTRPGQ
jgi:hypothetical protein